jgi:hypothetical protein
MSFVVEIPSIFTKPTQIPVRLGNTILSGNETIQGALQVNGSLTLNVGSNVDNTNVVYYDSLDISNTLSVGGNATIGGDLVVNGVINQTGASWSLGGLDDGVRVQLSVPNGENIPFSVKQCPEVNCIYDDTDDTITIQKAGKYLVNFGAMTGSNNNIIEIQLRKNGTIVLKGYSGTLSTSANRFRQVNGSMIIDLDVDDTLSVFNASVSGAVFDFEDYRYFNGYLIG